MKILIVEDDSDDAVLIEMVFKAGNRHETLHVKSAAEARDVVSDFKPDVMTLDSRLPDATINDTVRLIEEFKMQAGVIILTGSTTESQEWAARHAGADDYMSKNILTENPKLLLEAVKEARSAFRYRTIGENGSFKRSNLTKSQRITAMEIEKYTIEEPKLEPTPKEIIKQASPVERHLLESRDRDNEVLSLIVRGLNVNTSVTFKNKRGTERVGAAIAQVKKELNEEILSRQKSDKALKILMDRNDLLNTWLDRSEKLLIRLKVAAEFCAKNFLKVLALAVSGAAALALAGWVWTHFFHAPLPKIPSGD